MPTPLPFPLEELTSVKPLFAPAPAIFAVAPLGEPPSRVKTWFDDAAAAPIPDHDETIGTARLAAQAYARHAKEDNTRRAYRAGVRAWCAWCDQHALPCLPARSDDVVAFLAAERGRGLSVNTIDLRRAAIHYLHFIAGCVVRTAEAHVAETMARIHREAANGGDRPAKNLAATTDVLREILLPIPDDPPGLRDRALLLVGFAGALRRSELAAIRVEHLESRERGLRLTLPRSKGERAGKAVTVAIPYGTTTLCPVRALGLWQEAAGISEGALFCRIWTPPTRAAGPSPLPRPRRRHPGRRSRHHRAHHGKADYSSEASRWPCLAKAAATALSSTSAGVRGGTAVGCNLMPRYQPGVPGGGVLVVRI
jgi:hypothetical protein